jgi:hypothetical protein
MSAAWQQLLLAGLVTGDEPAAAPPPAAWYVVAMLGFAAWVAALFLVVVIAVFFDHKTGMGLAGLVACGVGLMLLRYESPFVAQLGLAASLAGQAGMFLGIEGALNGYRQAAAALAVILIGPSLFTTNNFYRAWCTTASLLLIAVSLREWGPLTIGLAAALVTVVFVGEAGIARAYGYGAAFALLLIDGFSLMDRSVQLPVAAYAGSLLAGVALVYALYQMRGTPKAAACGALVAIVLAPASGVPAAVLIMVIGFGRSAPVLLGLGIMAGLIYLSNFYYALSLTLFTKSLVLLGSGVALLSLRWALFRKEAAA